MIVKKKNFKFSRIYFLILILFLYSFNNFSAIKTCKASETNTLFVGGIGGKNYSKIQDAIDNSHENETVIVLNGVYNESIVINKSINLIGINKNNVFINGNDRLYVFLIESSYVNLSGFTIQGGEIGIFVSGPDFLFNNFSNNNITNNTEGIRFFNTSNNKIVDNIIQSHSSFGIVLHESCHNTISENLLLDNVKAISINKWSDNNIIQENNITENEFGILFDFSFNNLVVKNYIRNNSYGVYISNSEGNNITNNLIEFNQKCGIFSSNSDSNVISPNIFLENKQDIKLDTKPPEIKAFGFEFLLLFVAIFLIICAKKFK